MTDPFARPDRTPLYADALLPGFGGLFALAICYFLGESPGLQISRAPALFGGWFLGLLLVRLYPHYYRVLAMAPFGTLFAGMMVLVFEIVGEWPVWAVGGFAVWEGVAVGAILRFRDKFRQEGRQALLAAGVAILAGGAILATYTIQGPAARPTCRMTFLVAVGFLMVQCWLTLARPAFENIAELILYRMYRVRATGPGLFTAFPTTGPVLVIANHAAWFDPLFVADCLPRPVTPMMAAGFYDIWFLKPIMRRIIGAIRVPDGTFRREAPEVQEAISALDAGRVVIIFPEGYLRRKEEQPYRRFGQGVWQILKARPQTPVVACWVEGSWGTYFSFLNGPPMTNKKFDIRRQIQLGMSAPELVPAEVLVESIPARIYLLNRVLAARAHLGLPELREHAPTANTAEV